MHTHTMEISYGNDTHMVHFEDELDLGQHINERKRLGYIRIEGEYRISTTVKQGPIVFFEHHIISLT